MKKKKSLEDLMQEPIPEGSQEEPKETVSEEEAVLSITKLLSGYKDIEERFNVLEVVEAVLKELRSIPSGTEMDALYDDIKGALKEEQAKGRFQGVTLEDIKQAKDNSPYEELFQIAIKRRMERKILKVTTRPTQDLLLPMDIVNQEIWNGIADPKNWDGQLSFTKPSPDELIIFGADFTDFEKLENCQLSRSLDAYDKRVMEAVDRLFTVSGPYMTAKQIFYAMGNPETTNPAPDQLVKIDNSMMKQQLTTVYINNERELHGQKARYPKTVFRTQILQFETAPDVVINNNLVKYVYHILQEPRLMTFAKARKQITTVRRAVLESPLSKTSTNIRLEEYVLRRIAFMKNDRKRGRKDSEKFQKILFDTMFEECGIKRNKKIMKDRFFMELEHLKRVKHIKGYAEEEDGVTIKI